MDANDIIEPQSVFELLTSGDYRCRYCNQLNTDLPEGDDAGCEKCRPPGWLDIWNK